MSDPDYQELEADFGEVTEILREGRLDAPSEHPSEDVWNAIAQGLGSEAPAVEDPAVGDTARPAVSAEHQNVSSLESHRTLSGERKRSRGRTVAVIVAVAAALLLVAVPLGLALRGTATQRAELLALSGFEGSGEAELDGETLTVELDGLVSLDDGATYDVWLLDLEGNEPQDPLWIGFAEPAGTFSIPEGADLDQYSAVDVSREPDDGNAAHSGDSVLRGDLEQA